MTCALTLAGMVALGAGGYLAWLIVQVLRALWRGGVQM